MYTKSTYKHTFFNNKHVHVLVMTLNILRFPIRPRDLEDLLRSQAPSFQEISVSLGIKIKHGIFQFQKVLFPFPFPPSDRSCLEVK